MSGIYNTFARVDALAAVVHGKASYEVPDRYSFERWKVCDQVTSLNSTQSRAEFNSDDPVRPERGLGTPARTEFDKDAMRQFLSHSGSVGDAF